MVKIHAFLILKTNLPFSSKPVILAGYIESSNWISWFYKDTVREFAVFISKLLSERIKAPAKSQLQKDGINFLMEIIS